MNSESMRADSMRESIEHYSNMVYRLAFSMMKNKEDATLQWEQRYPIIEQVHNLPQKYKVVIHLFYYEEMSIKEIAHVLQLKESNVRALPKRCVLRGKQ